MSDLVDANNVLDVRRRALKASAVQFTGKNGKEVVAFVNESEDCLESTGRNGGTYVQLKGRTPDGIELKANIRKGDYVVFDADGGLYVYPVDEFARFYAIKGNRG